MTCPFENIQINYNSAYTKRISKKYKISVDEVKHKLLITNFPEIATESKFRFFYIEKEYSIPRLSKEFGLKYFQIQFLLKFYNIDSRNLSQAASTKSTRKQYKNTCNEKYGVDNVSQIEEVKNKKANTFVLNYGVDNIWKSESYYVWLDTFMIDKYGKRRMTSDNQSEIRKEYWDNLPPDEREERIKKILKNLHSGCYSKLETKISVILDEFKIPYERSFWLNKKQFDFRIKDCNILIEVQGDFWHANPKKYKANDILNHPKNPISAKELWEKDSRKLKIANSHGYNVIYLWESDIKDNKHIEILFNEIKKYKKD
jgi:G:T-mismatch repair DNA endonuclease (very short patch repair protein)